MWATPRSSSVSVLWWSRWCRGARGAGGSRSSLPSQSACSASSLVAATAVTGRPRPDVPHLDPAPPTSSYPSGYLGASDVLYARLATMATGIKRTWLRRTVIGVCSVIPVLVAYARLYRGMHHLSDVVVGAINGLVCAALAASCLLHQPSWFNRGHR